MDRLMVFSLVFCVAYVCAYYFDLSLFEYYPMTGEISFSASADPNAQTVHWYGWLGTSALASLAVAAIVPKRLSAGISPDILWGVVIFLVVSVIMYERRWFL